MIFSVALGWERLCVKGAARTYDHSLIVHALWKRFVELGLNVWIERVPTKDNIADNPSRLSSL